MDHFTQSSTRFFLHYEGSNPIVEESSPLQGKPREVVYLAQAHVGEGQPVSPHSHPSGLSQGRWVCSQDSQHPHDHVSEHSCLPLSLQTLQGFDFLETSGKWTPTLPSCISRFLADPLSPQPRTHIGSSNWLLSAADSVSSLHPSFPRNQPSSNPFPYSPCSVRSATYRLRNISGHTSFPSVSVNHPSAEDKTFSLLSSSLSIITGPRLLQPKQTTLDPHLLPLPAQVTHDFPAARSNGHFSNFTLVDTPLHVPLVTTSTILKLSTTLTTTFPSISLTTQAQYRP